VVFSFYHHGATPRRQHLEPPHPAPNIAPSSSGSRSRRGVKVAATSPNRAVFAAHRAVSCRDLARSLPLLPPITRNVKLSDRATRLEFGIQDGSEVATPAKSGKNGNVHRAGQHCHPISSPPVTHSARAVSPSARME
jgi:hypothetical protein